MDNDAHEKMSEKKKAEKNLFWSSSQAQERVKHMHFHFCESRLNEALKKILAERQLDPSIPSQTHPG